MRLRIFIILAGLLFGWFAAGYADSAPETSCNVLSATPDGKGGASVVFDCGSVTETIQEPVWP